MQGPGDWQPQVYFLVAGSTTVRWRYRQGNLSTTLENAAGLDQVKFTPGVTAPDFLQQPANLNAFQGSSATFQVLTLGTPPVQYELLRDGAPTGVTSANSALVLPAVTSAMSGVYSVRANNAAGTRLSEPVRLTVLPVPPVNNAFGCHLDHKPQRACQRLFHRCNRRAGRTGSLDRRSHGLVALGCAAVEQYRVVVEIPGDGVGLKLGIYRGSSLTQLVEELRVIGSSETIDDVSITRADGVFEATADTQYSFVLDTGFQESLC